MDTSTIANVEMAAAWDGPEGDDWTENAEQMEGVSSRLWAAFEERTPVAHHEVVLDVGCGTGGSTRSTARRASAGSVLGVDLSSRMLAYARERSVAEGIGNVDYVQADAQVHPFEPAAFDLAISSFGAMFFADPVAALANIGRAVRPGGRLSAIAWRTFPENEWLFGLRTILDAGRDLPLPPAGAPGPFGFAERERTERFLADAGFADIDVAPLDGVMVFGSDAEDAWAFVREMGMVQGLTADLDEQVRARVLDELRAFVDAHETADGVLVPAAAWVVQARMP
jgi:SAM-dependent methyltransferase